MSGFANRRHRGLHDMAIRMMAAAALFSTCLMRSAHAQKHESACAAAQKYKLIPVPLRPSQVNDDRHVVGTTEDHRAAFWGKTGLLKIDLPAGFVHAEGIAINDHDQVLGTASNADGSRRSSFVFAAGQLTMLPGEHSVGTAINRTGDIAGESQAAGKSSSGPVLWTKSGAVRLGDCCGGRATSLNDRGEAVGQVYDPEGQYHAFAWEAKHGLRLIGPKDAYSSAVAINEAGHVLVNAFTQGSLLYRDGSLMPLELSKKWPSQPRALNDCDVVVGSFGSNSDESRAFIWDEAHGFRDLNEMIAPGSGWTLEGAASINQHGEIAGWGDHNGEDDQGFLLAPERK